MANQYQKPVEALADKKILAYPASLGSSEKDDYGTDEQYMVIRINTDVKSSVLRNDKPLGQTFVTIGRTGTGIATSPFSSINNKLLSSTTNTDQATNVLYTKEQLKNEVFLVQKGMVSLDRVIVLPMPNEHSVNTSVRYNEYDPSDATKAGDTLNQPLVGVISDKISGLKNRILAAGINKFFSTTKKDLEFEERRMKNDKKEIMFDSFSFRTFSFNYTFAPKNQEESETVRSIIETLRYYSLPEISSGKVYYIFPSEFEISFMLGGKINPHIPKIATSVLQTINVNYSPNGVWSTLPNGAPLSLNIQMNFLELELIDRSRVYNKESVIRSGY